MSVPAGFIIEQLQDAVDTTADEAKVKILRVVNSVYLMIAELRPWSTLLKQVVNPGTVLPADLARPFYVEDNTDYLYFPLNSGARERYSSARLYNWWKNMAVATPLLTGTDAATTMDSTAVTSAIGGFTQAMVGEFIRIGSHPGVYKIQTVTSGNAIVLETAFKGANFSDASTWTNLTDQYFEVRPRGTLQAAYTDQNGALITSSSLKLWYSARPIPILRDWDQILLPGECNALFLGAHRRLLRGDKYDNDALKEDADFKAAISQMKSLDNLDDKFLTPRDRFGNRIAFGRHRNTSTASIHNQQL